MCGAVAGLGVSGSGAFARFFRLGPLDQAMRVVSQISTLTSFEMKPSSQAVALDFTDFSQATVFSFEERSWSRFMYLNASHTAMPVKSSVRISVLTVGSQ
jgi:hypothetical protein